MTYLQKLDSVLNGIIEPSAQKIDQESAFPREAITALGQSGLLGLMTSTDMGGMGLGLREASDVVEKISRVCPSTAMVVTMHYCGAVVIEKLGNESLRREIAVGKHLTTLAWSDMGSRSHFWAPVGKIKNDGEQCVIDGHKSMVTSAGEADSYVWSTPPFEAKGASTLWLMGKSEKGLTGPKRYDGVGLKGNASSPIMAVNVRLPMSAMLGTDGGGFDIMIGSVLPVFSTLIASCSIGIMDAANERATSHANGSKFEHLQSALNELPTIRSYLARAQIRGDMTRALRNDTLLALESNRADAMLRVMEVKAAAAEAALEVTDIAMRVCGGAAFRKDVGVERFFRDARAASIMAPTSDVLFDFIGKAVCGMPVFG